MFDPYNSDPYNDKQADLILRWAYMSERTTSHVPCYAIMLTYRIQPNYRTRPYMRTVEEFHVFKLQLVFFYLLLYKNICSWNSFELPRQHYMLL